MPSSNFYEALSLKTRVIHRNELNKIKESEIHDEVMKKLIVSLKTLFLKIDILIVVT